MAESRFVYVTYIRSTPEQVWQALIDPGFTRRYWFECWQECDWKPGSAWKLLGHDGHVVDAGEVVAFEPYTRFVLKWRKESMPEIQAEGYSLMTCELERKGSDAVKLTIVHEMERPDSRLIGMVAGGWPLVLAGLKSLLETGESFEASRSFAKV